MNWLSFSKNYIFSLSVWYKEVQSPLILCLLLDRYEKRKERMLNRIDGRRKYLEYIRLFFFPSTTLTIQNRRWSASIIFSTKFLVFSSISLINVIDKYNVGITTFSSLVNCEQANPMSGRFTIIVTNSLYRYATNSFSFYLHLYWIFFLLLYFHSVSLLIFVLSFLLLRHISGYRLMHKKQDSCTYLFWSSKKWHWHLFMFYSPFYTDGLDWWITILP